VLQCGDLGRFARFGGQGQIINFFKVIHHNRGGLSHTSVTSVKTHVPCECVQFDIRNPRKNKMRG
jgi:hypothetical protein